MLVKICGITSLAAALAAQQHGADFIGFIFAESKRRISAHAAARIAFQVPGVAKVGVFVNRPFSEVREIAELCRLDYVQLHGDEPPDYCRQLNRPVIKVLRAGPDLAQQALEKYQVDMLLLDSFASGQAGGTGTTFDWLQARQVVSRLDRPYLIAGGLTPENVAEAIAILAPTGVDTAGGVETGGAKDEEKIRRFIAAAKAAGRTKENA